MRALVTGMAVALLAGEAAAADRPDVDRGKDVFERWCSACHAPGPGHPGTQALQAKYKGAKPPALEDRRDLPPDQVKFFVRHGVSIMPFFRKTEISDKDLDDLAAYVARKR